MANLQQLVAYINQYKARYPAAALKAQLLKQGIPEAEVDQALRFAYAAPAGQGPATIPPGGMPARPPQPGQPSMPGLQGPATIPPGSMPVRPPGQPGAAGQAPYPQGPATIPPGSMPARPPAQPGQPGARPPGQPSMPGVSGPTPFPQNRTAPPQPIPGRAPGTNPPGAVPPAQAAPPPKPAPSPPGTVSLPGQAQAATTPPAAGQTPAGGPAKPPPGRTYILVVDDDQLIRDMMVQKLEGAGYRVTCAEDAAQSVIQAEGMRLALIVSDIEMPGFGTGVDALKKLRASSFIRKNLPVIFVTGMPPAEARKIVPKTDPYVRLLHKPVDWKLLRQYIKDLTGLDNPLD